jgi:TolA-binding protein
LAGALAGVAISLAFVNRAGADTVAVRGLNDPPTTPPTVYSGVKVNGITDGKINFSTAAGNSVTKDFATVVQMTIDDEPTFNLAEQEFAENHFEKAVDDYATTIAKTDKDWLKAYCLPHLAEAANQAGRFDEAEKAYIALVQQQPVIAGKYRPKVPAAGSTYLDQAATDVGSAADAPGITTAQQQALLAFLLEIDRARGDLADVNTIGQKLTTTGDANDALTNAALADAKIALAQQAIDQKDFDKALALIGQGKLLFTDTAHQADALYLSAQAIEGKADAAKNADGLKDAAVAYFRVVADFKQAKDAPHVADALLHAGGVFEKLNEPANARQTYDSIVRDYPKTPAADAAQQALKKLAATTQPG